MYTNVYKLENLPTDLVVISDFKTVNSTPDGDKVDLATLKISNFTDQKEYDFQLKITGDLFDFNSDAYGNWYTSMKLNPKEMAILDIMEEHTATVTPGVTFKKRKQPDVLTFKHKQAPDPKIYKNITYTFHVGVYSSIQGKGKYKAAGLYYTIYSIGLDETHP